MIFPATIKGHYVEQMSDDEFFHFCQENRDLKFERTGKREITVMSPTTFLTGKRNNEILYQLNRWNKTFKLGETVDSDTGFFLPNNSMRNPDAAWVSFSRLSTIDKNELNQFPHLVPDFVVELVSKNDRLSVLKDKMKEWMANGCCLGWLIDADEEIVYVFEGDQERRHVDFNTPLSAAPFLPGFELILSELRI